MMFDFKPVPYGELPDIQLYMDQVLGYLDRHLEAFLSEEGENALTKTMINNYVKAGLLEKPVKKRYGQDQLAGLIMIYFLKNVVSMQTIEALGEGETDVQQRYARFNAIQENVLKETREWMQGRKPDGELALELLIRADLFKRLAEKMIQENI